MVTITREQARRFILSKQGLLGKYRFAGKEGALSYVRQAGCIQYDPVDVCGKNAELTLLSRVRGFTKKTLADLLYQDRLLVDYKDKELSIWPAEDWPYFSRYRQRSIAHGQGFPGLKELEEEAIAYIRSHGPVSSESLPIEGMIFWHSSLQWSGHWDRESKAARSVLEQLYTDGVLLIHHKQGSRKFYDLAENHLDRMLLTAEDPCQSEEDFLCWRILRRIGAIGLLWNRRSDAWLGIEMTAPQRTDAFTRLEAKGQIVRIQVEGIKDPLYLLSGDFPLLEAASKDAIDKKPRLEFLAPLDPMLWDRRLVEAIWDYQYTWEIYTPMSKRKYGHYVLPMVYGQNLIGRIEAIADRKADTLTVPHIWYEPGVSQTKGIKTALEKSLKRLASFNECREVQVAEVT